jgi:hypothetical protein
MQKVFPSLSLFAAHINKNWQILEMKTFCVTRKQLNECEREEMGCEMAKSFLQREIVDRNSEEKDLADLHSAPQRKSFDCCCFYRSIALSLYGAFEMFMDSFFFAFENIKLQSEIH